MIKEYDFFTALKLSKEDDAIRCLEFSYQRIINNGDYTFLWEESWEPVKLRGEFIGLKWAIEKR